MFDKICGILYKKTTRPRLSKHLFLLLIMEQKERQYKLLNVITNSTENNIDFAHTHKHLLFTENT